MQFQEWLRYLAEHWAHGRMVAMPRNEPREESWSERWFGVLPSLLQYLLFWRWSIWRRLF